MLQAIRDRAQGWFAWLIVAFITLPFLFWGVNSYFDFGPQDQIAKVVFPKDTWLGSKTYEINAREFRLFVGPNAKPEQMSSPQSVKQVEERLLMTAAAYDSGLRVGPELLGEEIRREFSEDGQFNPVYYEQARGSIGTRRWNVDTLLEMNVSSQLLRSGVLATAFQTEAELKQEVKLRQQTRDIGYALVKHDRFVELAQVTEEEAKKHYEENKQRYKTPEKITLEYVELLLADMMKEVAAPDDAALQSRYEDYKLSAKVPEQRRVSQILVKIGEGVDADAKAKQKALDIHKKILEGGDFAQIAREQSDDFSRKDGGDIGFVSEDSDMLAPVLKQALFALAPNGVSEPAKTEFGYQIVKLTELKKGETPAFETVKDKLIADFMHEKAEEAFDVKREIISRKVFEERNSLVATAKAFGLPLKTEGPFERGKPVGIASRSEIRELMKDEKFLEGINSDGVESGGDVIYFVHLKDRSLPAVKPFEAVKDDVFKELKNKKAQEQAKIAAQSLKEKMEKSADPAETAKTEQSEWQIHNSLKRDDGKTDASIRRKVFKMPKPAAVDKPVWDFEPLFNGDYAVVALYKVEDGKVEGLDKQALDSDKKQIEFMWMMSEWQAFMDSLRDRAEVETHPDRL